MSAKTILAQTSFVKTAKVVILYDDLETLLAANQRVERMPLRAGEAGEWVVHSWQFDMLRLGVRLESYRALEEAIDADLMLVAISDAAAVDDFPMDWLESCAGIQRLREAKLSVLPFGLAAKVGKITPYLSRLWRLAKLRDLPLALSRAEPSGNGPAKEFKNAIELGRSVIQKLLVQNLTVTA